MSYLSSLRKNLFAFLVLSLFWLWLCSLVIPVPADNVTRGCVLAAVLAIEGVIISTVHKHEQRMQRSHEFQRSLETRAYLQRHLKQLPDFSLDYWCVLATSPEEETRALAVDTNATQIALLDFIPSSNKLNTTPSITTKILKRGDVANVTLEETTTRTSKTMWSKFVEGPSTVQHASYFMGAEGMNPYREKDPQFRESNPVVCSSNPPTPSPSQNQERQEIKLYLKLTLRSDEAPVEYLDFLVGEVEPLDNRYSSARRRAQHWRDLFENFKRDALA